MGKGKSTSEVLSRTKMQLAFYYYKTVYMEILSNLIIAVFHYSMAVRLVFTIIWDKGSKDKIV